MSSALKVQPEQTQLKVVSSQKPQQSSANLSVVNTPVFDAPVPKAQESIDLIYKMLDKASKTDLAGCVYNDLSKEIKTVIFAIARYRHEGSSLTNQRVEMPLYEFNQSEKQKILSSINDLVDSLQGLAHIPLDKFK